MYERENRKKKQESIVAEETFKSILRNYVLRVLKK